MQELLAPFSSVDQTDAKPPCMYEARTAPLVTPRDGSIADAVERNP